MTTLLTALFYLWLVITILLAIMWFLRRQDRRRDQRHQDEADDAPPIEAMAEPATDPPSDGATEQSDVPENGDRPIATLGLLLAGLELPFDLAPISGELATAGHHTTLISPHANAEEVGTAFADQLVLEGFEVEAAGFDRAIATRDHDVLTMRIRPDAGRADGEEPPVPDAEETDVAIELWIGDDPETAAE